MRDHTLNLVALRDHLHSGQRYIRIEETSDNVEGRSVY